MITRPADGSGESSASRPWPLARRHLLRVTRAATSRLLSLHHCQQGSISILSVFTFLALAMLLGMVLNTGRQVDGKVRMQNAADAVAYSGGATIARGMNALAFSNHLLCEVFALTAYCREMQDGRSNKYIPDILQHWKDVASNFTQPRFQGTGLEKFRALATAIGPKADLEKEFFTTFAAWGKAFADQFLPTLETVLEEELIPTYQRALYQSWPSLVQATATEVARRNGLRGSSPDSAVDPQRGTMYGGLWKTTGAFFGEDGLSLPVADPFYSPSYANSSRLQRSTLAHYYLRLWCHDRLLAFDGYDPWSVAKMCNYRWLFEGFACDALETLLGQNDSRNLLFMIDTEKADFDRGAGTGTAHLASKFTFIGTAYWKQLTELLPGLFTNPIPGDSVTYAEVRVFVPKRRWVWVHVSGGGGGSPPTSIGGMFGDTVYLDNGSSGTGGAGNPAYWRPGRQARGTTFRDAPCARDDWNLLNQNWTAQITPCVQPQLAAILQSVPPIPGMAGAGFRPPQLGSLSEQDIQQISPH